MNSPEWFINSSNNQNHRDSRNSDAPTTNTLENQHLLHFSVKVFKYFSTSHEDVLLFPPKCQMDVILLAFIKRSCVKKLLLKHPWAVISEHAFNAGFKNAK